MPMALQSLYSQ